MKLKDIFNKKEHFGSIITFQFDSKIGHDFRYMLLKDGLAGLGVYGDWAFYTYTDNHELMEQEVVITGHFSNEKERKP